MEIQTIARINKYLDLQEEDLNKINALSLKTVSREDIITFEILVCDNEVDRDNDMFSEHALIDISSNIIGKTLILDHEWESKNQVGRIYDSQVVISPTQKTTDNKNYAYVKCKAYIPVGKTALVDDIKTGVKKEVSIGCSVSQILCSECGNEWLNNGCSHYAVATILNKVDEVFELSFVAVPAQRNAGVIKNELINKKLINKKLKNKIYKNAIQNKINKFRT